MTSLIKPLTENELDNLCYSYFDNTWIHPDPSQPLASDILKVLKNEYPEDYYRQRVNWLKELEKARIVLKKDNLYYRTEMRNKDELN